MLAGMVMGMVMGMAGAPTCVWDVCGVLLATTLSTHFRFPGPLYALLYLGLLSTYYLRTVL